jgi:succinate-semialdehyde dehydrogenase/glutarate-semialdehyde dehydrogenase
MPSSEEKTFGLLVAMVKAKNESEACALSQQSDFALGATVCTRNVKRSLEQASEIGDGALFINELVKFDQGYPLAVSALDITGAN